MAGYGHEDDDYDIASDGEEFNEDTLDDAEYDQLYAQLPILKKELANYNEDILEIDMKEALYYNYYKIEDSVNELKDKYPRKKKVIIPPSPVLANNSPAPETKKPLSKLAQLAQQRKQQQQQQQQQQQNQHQRLDQTAPEATEKPLSKLALLAKSKASNRAALSLDSLKRVPRDTDKKTLSLGASKISNSTLSKLRKRTKDEADAVSPAVTPPPVDITVDRSSGTKTSVLLRPANIPSHNVVFDDSNLLKLAKSPLSCFLFNENDIDVLSSKKRKLSQFRDIFEPITNHEVNSNTAKKIQASFNEPSPDQKILDAQSAAFEANMGGLKIGEAAKKQPQSKDQDVKNNKDVAKQSKPFKKIDLDSRIKSSETYLKPRKSFVVIGHVDAGKSTLLGRILYDVGVVDAKQLNKLTREADRAGKGSFALAWIMDQTTEERSRGVTVDICATNFETARSKFTAIDAPGHKDFVPQMISGVTQANYAVVVIDSINGEFESGFNMDGQTKEHTLLARYLGVERIIVVVNKMDKENWSQERYNDIKQQMLNFLTNPENDVTFKQEQIEFIPLSGLTGNNLVKRDQSVKEFTWYIGPTLIEYLDLLEIPKGQQTKSGQELSNEEFKFTINDVFESSSSDFIVSGKILSGAIQPGETVKILPGEEIVQVQSITSSTSSDQQNLDFAILGDVVQLKFKTNQLNNTVSSISTGDMILSLNSPIKSKETFTCEVKLFQMPKPLLVGTPFVLFRNTFQSLARITKIIEIKLDEKKKKKKMHLVSKQVAVIEIQSERPLAIATYEQNEILGRVVLRREGLTIGAGKIIEVEQ